MLRIRILGAASLAAIIAASTSLAAEPENFPEQNQFPVANASADRIVVEGKYLSLDKLNAVKTPTPIINVPQSLSIIDSEQISRQAFANLGDVLRYTPGLSISQGEGHRDSIIIRGNQSTADFFLDGLRDDVQYYRPLYNLSQIEILRGSNALLFGRGGVGGVVNRVTKRPEFNESFTGYAVSVDTFGAHSISGDANIAVGEDASFRVNAMYEGMNNHRDFFDGERFAVNPTFAFMATPDTEVLLSYEYLNDDRTVDRGVPSVTVADGPDRPLEGYDNSFFGSADGNLTTLEAHIARARVDHTFSDSLRGNFTVQYANYDKLYQNIYAADFDNTVTPSQITLDGYQDATQRRNLILQTNLISEFETGPVGHTILFGAEYGDQETANSRNDNYFTDSADDQIIIDFTDPLVIPEFAFSTPVRDRRSDVRFVSIYLQDQIDLTNWLKVVGGVRYDRFEIDVDDIVGSSRFSRTDSEFTPRLGAILKPADDVSFYFSYSKTFLPRSGDQFLSLDLDSQSTRPQFTTNKEAGVKWDITPDLSFTAALFDLDRQSFTSVDPEAPEQLIIIEGSETKGVEFQLTGDVTENWFVTAGYSYMDGSVERVDGSGNDGAKPRQTPENMFSVWNIFQATQKLGLGLGATYQDSYFVTEDNSVEVPDFIRVDAAVYYDVSDKLRLQVNIENLFDEDYFPDAHNNNNISTGKPLSARFAISGRL